VAKPRSRRRLRTFVGIFAILGILFFGSLILTYVFQDEIVEAVLDKVNESLKEPVTVEEVTFSALTNFPQMGVTMQGITVPPGAGNKEEPLLKAGKFQVLLNIMDVIRGDYNIRSIHLENGELYLRTLANGEVNYDVAVESTEVDTAQEEDGTSQPLELALESFTMKQFLIRYADEKVKDDYSIYIESTDAGLEIKEGVYTVRLNGDLQARNITLGGEPYLKEKPLSINTTLTYEDSTGAVEVLPSELVIRDSEFKLRGNYTPGTVDQIDLVVSADEVNLRTLVSLLPESLAGDLSQYRSRGQMYFSGSIKGGVSGSATPAINLDFGGQDVSLSHPDYDQTFDHVFFEGNFTNGRRLNLNTSAITIRNLKGELNGKPITASFALCNFEDYQVEASLSGQMDVPALLRIAELEAVEEADGYLDAEVSFKGRLADLESADNIGRVNTSGTLGVRDMDVTLADWPIPLKGISGTFRFNSTDLAIQNVQGKVGQSHLRFNGILNNLVGYLLLEDQDFVVQADLFSDYLDLDELLSGDPIDEDEVSEVQEDQEYSFSLPERVVLDFNADINQLNFRYFHASNLTGNLSMENQVVDLSDVSLRTMGGRMQMKATLNNQDSLKVPIDAQVRLERVDIDSIFYVMENFDQDYLTHENLKGQLFADIDLLLPMNNQLEMEMDEMIGDISMSVKNGELNDFETLQELSRFVEEEELANLRFSELSNNLRIEQGKLFIPDMLIKTNIAEVGLRGIQSFDDDIDYRFRLGLQEFRKPDADARFGLVEDDGTGLKNVFIRVHGTLDDYKIEYDGKAARAYRKEQRKTNPFRLRDLFQTRDREPKQIQLNEEEFFEWEEGDGG